MLDTLARLRTYESPLTSAAAEHCQSLIHNPVHAISSELKSP